MIIKKIRKILRLNAERLVNIEDKLSSVASNSEKLDKIEKKITELSAGTQGEDRGPQQAQSVIDSYIEKTKDETLTSTLCKEIDFSQPWYKERCEEIKEIPRLHRKQWEYAYIIQALHQRGLLEKGKKGLGFAVGTEPLPALFAKYGANITATDLEIEEGKDKGWANGEQLCYGLDSLNQRGICPDKEFKKLVSYEAVDMNDIPDSLSGYDFTWSACAFEHLGSIKQGLDFVKNQMKTLKSGGWAIHTSELNISSNDETVENETYVLFRQSDYEKLAAELRKQGHYVEKLNFALGWMPNDFVVDMPPYKEDPHLRLQIDQYVSTSFGIIIRKK